MRQPLVVANWKMNGSSRENRELIESITANVIPDVDIAVCPPFVYLGQVAGLTGRASLALGAQDVSQNKAGAYTGDISASMLADLGCDYVIVGHSERRQYHLESSELVAEKFVAAQQSGLTPILCVGENLQERDTGATLAVIASQLDAVLARCGGGLGCAVIAYEPVWAIGSGRTATPQQAQEVHEFIRGKIGTASVATRILYGGSVKPANARELFVQPDVDGALVGGASLVANDFLAICRAASEK